MKTSVTLTPELRLEQALKQAGVEKPEEVTKLAVAGTMIYPDFQYIEENMAETLQELDMSAASPEDDCMCFNECTGLTSVIIPDSVVEIGEDAFAGCERLTSVTIPDSVKEIGASVFGRGGGVFRDCTALTSITIPNSVSEIKSFTFTDCTGLTSIVIPDSVVEIGKNAFEGCTGLTSVTIPDSVVEIGENAFEGCTGLTSVVIPRSVAGIGDGAFKRCRALITVHPDNPVYTIKNGKIAFKNVKGVSCSAGDAKWTLSNGVLTISGNRDCLGEWATIPDYDDYLHGGCTGARTDEGRSPWYPYRKLIKKIVFEGNISLTGIFAFSGCDHLTSVTFQAPRVSGMMKKFYQGYGIGTINQAIHGFTYGDLWNIDSWFSRQIPRMLKEFKRNSLCHPGNMTSEEWDAILDRMAFCFSERSRLAFNYDETEKCREMQKEGLALFCKYFDDLWW